MTHTWQRRALGIIVLLALLGLGVVLGEGVGDSAERSAATISNVADHAAFASLPESRRTVGYVEPLALFGLGLVLFAGLLDLRLIAATPTGPVGPGRQRRWRAQLEGAPPIRS